MLQRPAVLISAALTAFTLILIGGLIAVVAQPHAESRPASVESATPIDTQFPLSIDADVAPLVRWPASDADASRRGFDRRGEDRKGERSRGAKERHQERDDD